MADISFNEPQYQAGARANRASWFSSLVIKMGLAKDEASAQKVLLVGAIVIAALAVGVFIYGNPSAPNPPSDAELMLQ